MAAPVQRGGFIDVRNCLAALVSFSRVGIGILDF